MNMHLPQSIEAMTELRMLAAVPKQIIIAKNNAPVIAAVQDSVVGVYRMTHNDFVVSRAKDAGDPLKIHLAARDVMNIMMAIKGFRGPLPPPTIPATHPENRTGIDLWSGKDIFHAIMPGMFVDMKTDFGRVKISPKGYENREGIDAPIDVGVLNKGSRGIVHQVFLDKGSDACSDFLDNLQNIIVMFLIQSGFSVGLSDLIADNETNGKILDIIRSKKEEVARIIRSIHNGTFENKTSRTNQSVFEERVNSILNSAINEAGKVGTKSLAWNNRMTNMVKAGSKGKTLNIAQMMACVGQVNVDGQRIPYGFEGRTLPHFQRYDDSPEARGFVENSFVRGLTPTEFFFHAQSGREGLIDTAVKTSATGYVQRQMVKAMEDLKVHYDQTVRTANGAIVQMAYGEDGMDSTRVIAQVVPSLEQTVYDIYSTNAFREDDVLEDFLTPVVANQVREQLPALIERTRKLSEKIVEDRDSILDSAGEKVSAINYPIPFERIISEITEAMRGDVGIFSNLSPMEVLDWMDELEKETRLNPVFGSNDMFMALARVFLSPRVLIREKRVTREQFMMIMLRIRTYFEKSLVHPGEMVGVVSAQSIGEPATQMSCLGSEKVRLVSVSKKTGEIDCQNVEIGPFCDELIQAHPEMTFSTGHSNSVETLIETLPRDYYIVGVDSKEQTRWNKLSHISRHPVNGDMIRVKTRSGRVVNTTASHSHLYRDSTTHTVKPIRGDDLKEGMRIPVCRKIETPFTKKTIEYNGEMFELNETFGWFIGAYLADGSLNGNTVRISKMNESYSANVKKFADSRGYTCSVVDSEGEYGPSRDTCVQSKNLAKLLQQFCGVGSFVKKVPDFAFIAPKVFQQALLRGYMDGDGNFNSDSSHHSIRASSRSEQLIKDIAMLLSNFGIYATIHMRMVSGKPNYEMSILVKNAIEYKQEIGSESHTEELDSIVDWLQSGNPQSHMELVDKIPGIGGVFYDCAKALGFANKPVNMRKWRNVESIGRKTLSRWMEKFEASPNIGLVEDKMDILRQALNGGVVWDEIVEIVRTTPEDMEMFVYDFTVPGNQTFMTDYGVIIHNTLNSFHYETDLLVKYNGNLIKTSIGDMVENYFSQKDVITEAHPNDTHLVYSKKDDSMEVLSPDLDGNVKWRKVEALTKHPVINKDGTNTLIRVNTRGGREVIATKAKSFVRYNQETKKLEQVNGEDIHVGDLLPIHSKGFKYPDTTELDLKMILPSNKYIYGDEFEKARAVMNEHHWWSTHSGKTFNLPYKRSDSCVVALNNTDLPIEPGFVYPAHIVGVKSKIPARMKMDWRFGYLIGAYCAEGCVTKTQISIANNDNDYLQPIIDFCEEYGITYKVYCQKDKCQAGWVSQDIRIYSTVLTSLILGLCGKLSDGKTLHPILLTGNTEFLSGICSGYFGGDGTVSRTAIQACSVSKELLEHMQLVLLRLNNIYSTIHPNKLPIMNNRGTTNFKQSYNLCIRNGNVYRFTDSVHLTIASKEARFQKLRDYQFRNDQNSLNKGIVLNDVVLDDIVSIVEVPNDRPYVYDLTVEDTRIFQSFTGLALNDTFHLSGVAEKSNVTRGVPRLNEILHLSKNLKSPSVTVFLEGASMADRAAADVIRKKLVRTKVSDIVKRLRIAYDPRNYATTLGVVRPVYHWKLQLIMDAEEMHERDITMEDVHIAIAKGLGGKFGEVLVQSSDMNADELVVALSVATAGEIADEDSGDAIRLLRDLETLVIEKVVVRGVRGIEHCVLRKMPPTMVKVDQEYQNVEQYVVDTVGTNLLEILGTPGVDQRRTYSNHILEINQVLGIDAARNSIIRELQDVFETYINYHHLSLLADKMTSRGIPISIDRHGVNKSDSGPLAKASFEETDTVLLNAAQMGELDPVTGVTANIMFGQPIPGGTGMSQVLLDEDMFLKVFRPPKAVSEEDKALEAAREEEERKAAYCDNKDIRLHRLDTKGVSMVSAVGWMDDDVDF
jgi:DNA-directed RNA polymerase beta' subunit